MNPFELKAELSMRMLELEKAIDTGMPYRELKRVYSEIKELQLKLIVADVQYNEVKPKSNDLVIE
jgi:hypothetical protein